METNTNTVEQIQNLEPEASPAPKKKRGFATMSPERRAEISSKGGIRSHQLGTAHKFSSEEAKVAGQKGGVAPHRTRGRVRTSSEEA